VDISKNLTSRLANWSMMIALFFNPLGFDVIQYWLTTITGSLWYANLVMYVMAGLFFGLAILFRWRSRKKIETSNTSDV
jgi:hypothetical protein